ncbi:MAG: TonB-dependent receptor, partial [Candidatus Neomarinimicrobiota bacterium]
ILLKTDLWFLHRTFDNKLPFQDGGQVDLIRSYYGFNSKAIYHINFRKTLYKIMFGIEMNNLFDSRKRYDNLTGTRGNMVYNSDEKFLMGASYLQCQATLDNHQLYFGARIDYNQIKLKDNFFESDSLDNKSVYKNLTPLFGYRYQFNEKLASFVNYTTHFETPTLYEIGNSSELNPQQSAVGEIGFISESNRSEYIEIVLFKSKTTSEIIPFEIENEPGRSYFKNAGSTTREGLELSLRKNITQKSNLQFIHTFTNYRFVNFNSNGNVLNGNYFPAIPRYFGKLNFLNELNRNTEFDLEIYYAGKVFLDDNNTSSTSNYMLASLNVKRKLILFDRHATIFCYIENIFNTPYSSNIRMNAWGGRFFEPGPTRRYSIGIKF